MDEVTALGELHRIRACACVELEDMCAMRYISHDVGINLVPHPREMWVIFCERVILLCRAREGFGNCVGLIRNKSGSIHLPLHLNQETISYISIIAPNSQNG